MRSQERTTLKDSVLHPNHANPMKVFLRQTSWMSQIEVQCRGLHARTQIKEDFLQTYTNYQNIISYRNKT